ncbi:MAG: leucine-rich repeat domain-containing protein [Alistipes sp.]|nr:leucine-rich repeat domain-containing protein [Alistipes sp.]
MKLKNIILLSSITALGMLWGCVEDNAITPGFETDSASIEARPEGGEFTLRIESSKEWMAISDVPWVMISPANGRGSVECIIKIDSTLVNDSRTTDIRFSSAGEILREVAVTQEGYARSIVSKEESHEIAASATRADRWFEIEVNSNVEFDVTAEYDSDDEWLKVGDHTLTLDRGARPRDTRIKVEWKMNPEPRERVAKLHLSGEGIEEPTTVVIRQLAAPLIEDNRQGDSLAVVTIFEKLECWSDNGISTTEGMHRWDCVRLWEATDEALPAPEAVGRVRDLDLSYFNTEEGIPQEIRYLKYLETLSLFGNVNTMLKSIEMGEEICDLEYLKGLRIAAYGIVSLPRNFARLGDTLETLDLNSNNLNVIPEVLTPENFPHLKSLNLASNRRASISDLRKAESANEDGIGLHTNTNEEEALRRLLLWEALEELTLSYNYIEGPLPDFKAGEEGVRAYTAADVAERGDTLLWAVESGLPRILPNARVLRINLNFLSGTLPDWLLYHPRLLEWVPEILVYPQQENGVDTEGDVVGFDNEPTSPEYYFEKYPLMRGRFEFNDEMTE